MKLQDALINGFVRDFCSRQPAPSPQSLLGLRAPTRFQGRPTMAQRGYFLNSPARAALNPAANLLNASFNRTTVPVGPSSTTPRNLGIGPLGPLPSYAATIMRYPVP
ncbi:hypothetical protein L7F22_010595 [Adiantum nelumboides]|nr:hypothetical protein [Adiantum nelumboides]